MYTFNNALLYNTATADNNDDNINVISYFNICSKAESKSVFADGISAVLNLHCMSHICTAAENAYSFRQSFAHIDECEAF